MKEEDIIRSERYLSHSLNEDEKRQFESDLKKDVELERAYNRCKLAMDAVNREAEEELRHKFVQWRQANSESKSRRLYSMIAIAASVLLVIVFYFMFRQVPGESGEAIALQWYKPPQQPAGSMGEAEERWARGAEAFRQGNFADAADQLSKIEHPAPEVIYYLAHSYFRNGAFDKASFAFQQLSAGSSVYSYPSDWYLALSLLADGQYAGLNEQLERITSDNSHPYFKDARELKTLVDRQRQD